MIKSEVFYRAFEAGAASIGLPEGVLRGKGKIPKYTAHMSLSKVSFWFKVNSKASAIPHQPGEFWPDIAAPMLRHGERDDGLVSWYQYTDPAMNQEILALQRSV